MALHKELVRFITLQTGLSVHQVSYCRGVAKIALTLSLYHDWSFFGWKLSVVHPFSLSSMRNKIYNQNIGSNAIKIQLSHAPID